jgi:Ribonucleotide reductase, all-alpha domain
MRGRQHGGLTGRPPGRGAMRGHLTENALKVLEARYLRRDARGRVIETPGELFRGVARSVAQAVCCLATLNSH